MPRYSVISDPSIVFVVVIITVPPAICSQGQYLHWPFPDKVSCDRLAYSDRTPLQTSSGSMVTMLTTWNGGSTLNDRVAPLGGATLSVGTTIWGYAG
jgi:hypothetical protein